jgi:hypothetical protein
MDYNLETILVALVAHRLFDGGTESSVTAFANDLFARFDDRIRQRAGTLNLSLSPDDRTVIAAIASLLGGAADDAAQDALSTFVKLFAN